MRKERCLIGVIGAEMQSIEQQRLLYGIIEQAQKENADAAVFSNIFNPLEPEYADCCENRIYSLLHSPALNAIIVFPESIVNATLRRHILEQLRDRQDIPVLLIGASMPGFRYPCISTNDANDMEEITGHLIEAHGYRDIALLTGPLSADVSRTRIEGYRKALECRGIPFAEEKVFEGDFWYTSGDRLAKSFISGEKPMPEALVCANDYMAFGVLDAFESAGISILGRMALTGYEFIQERNLHTPLLTTYQRNRTELGRIAVQILMRKLRGEAPLPFEPPRGEIIHGMTCACNVSRIVQHEELTDARLAKQYADWSLKSGMEQMLTECKDMDAFAKATGEFMFLLHGVSDILLCLFEDWHRQESVSDILLCRSVNPWADHTVFKLKKENLTGLTGRDSRPCAYYWLPLCFGERFFGYCVLRYDRPLCYDDVCRSWIKAVANGLEFLRLKADVHYLLQCRVLSGAYDSMTGMFSREGLENAFHLMQNTDGANGSSALLLRCLPGNNAVYHTENPAPLVEKLLAAAGVIRQFRDGICGRISEYEFLLLFPSGRITPLLLENAVTAELLRVMEIGTFLCAAGQFPAGTAPETLIEALTAEADQCAAQRSEAMLLPHFSALSPVRNTVYREPAAVHSTEHNAAALGFNPDYFNRKYKECFGLSFHQDCIRSRVLFAVHLLMQTDDSIARISEHCGYTESKYFIRQFSAVTGSTPGNFRRAVSGAATAAR